jgi:polar amino acid transport system substrate-binding protein
MPRKIHQWLLLLSLSGLAWPANAAQEIQLLTDYTAQPYAVNGVAPADSYTVRLAQWLSQHSAGRYQFVPRQVPKKRLLYMMAQPDWLGVAAWVNPLWVDDAQRQRYLWSAVVQREHDFLVSRKTDKVELVQGSVNRAARFGGLNGYFYPSLEAGFKSGLLSRENAQNHLSSVRKLQRRRIDVIILPASVLASVREEIPDFGQWAYISPEPQAVYELFLAGNRNNPELMTFINQTLPKLAQDPSWVELLNPGEQ